MRQDKLRCIKADNGDTLQPTPILENKKKRKRKWLLHFSATDIRIPELFKLTNKYTRHSTMYCHITREAVFFNPGLNNLFQCKDLNTKLCTISYFGQALF